MNMLKVELLKENDVREYEKYILSFSQNMIYSSDMYRKLLKRYFQIQDFYLIARNQANEIIGALPAFLFKNKYGNVLNSLPFYGSNGGVIEYRKDEEVWSVLLTAFMDLARREQCITSTLITTPNIENEKFYKMYLSYDYYDRRISQKTILSENQGDTIACLSMKFHSVVRRNIRKAIKTNVIVSSTYDCRALAFLYQTHDENMKKIFGNAKDKRFFEVLSDTFSYGENYRIYMAYIENRPIAALLLLYYNKTVEYFTPVIQEEYRSYQPLSLIIYQAMADAIGLGYKYWNWGGTWVTQEGVYNFKKKWNTTEEEYRYFTKIYDDKVYSCDEKFLLREYPNFYVIPFGRLNR